MDNPWNTSTDASSRAFYPWPVDEYREINLRSELALLFYGGDGLTPKAHPILYRRFDKSAYCTCVKDGRALSTCPICEGEMYPFTDYLYYTRRRVIYGTADTSTEPTILNVHRIIFYLEYWTNPVMHDIIFEINAPDRKLPTNPIKQQRFLIESVDTRRDENGEIAFYQCWAQEQIIGPFKDA